MRGMSLLLGLVLVLVGIFLPREWYDALPQREGQPTPPIKGVTLLQLSLVLEGLLVVWLSTRRWVFERSGEADRLPDETGDHATDAATGALFPWLLAATVGLGLALRTFGIGSDLWLDEITPLQDYGHLSPLAVVGSFLSTNNHLLNTLLTQLSTTLFGEAEWSVRLPAVLFGAATVPALYWVARLAFSRRDSLAAALLLAVSYHHIFFSQNARGYSAYVFFSLVASGLLIRGLQEDRLRIWVLYIVVMVLDFASLLNSAFVLGAHGVVWLAVLWMVHRRGGSLRPLLGRLIAVFTLIGLLVLQLYATVLPKVYVFVRNEYVGGGSGYSLASGEFFRELARGLSAGFGPGLLWGAVPFLLLAFAGYVILWRRRWILALTLVLPLVLTAAYLIVNGLTFSPRFFIFALPLAMITAIPSMHALASLVARLLGQSRSPLPARLATALVAVACLASLWSLRGYYAVPKQSYRASIAYLEGVRQPGEIVLVVYNAERGYRYYLDRMGVQSSGTYFYVRSVDSLDAVLASHEGQASYVVLTFPRSLHFHSAELESRLLDGWTRTQRFPATVGDGAISIWTERSP